KNPAPLNALLEQVAVKSESVRTDVLNGMAEGLIGWRKATKPSAWDGFATKLVNSSNPTLRDQVRNLSALFGDGRALDEVKKIAVDQQADLTTRKTALQTMIDNRAPDLRPVC